MELTLWVEQYGAREIGDNVRGALATISKNEEFINMTLAMHRSNRQLDAKKGCKARILSPHKVAMLSIRSNWQ